MTPRRRHSGGSTSSRGSDSGSSSTPPRQSGGPGGRGVDVDPDSIDSMAGRLRGTGGRVDAVGTTLDGINVGPQSMGIVGGSFTGSAQAHVRTAKQHVTRAREAVQNAENNTRTTANNYRRVESTNVTNLSSINTDTHVPTTKRDSGTTTPASSTTTADPVSKTPTTRDSGGTTTPSGTDRDGTTSPNRPARPDDTRTREADRVCESDPVDVASGEMILAHYDVELPGVLPLVLRRTHVSSYRAGVSFGPSWASTVDQRLELDGRGVVFLADDGMILVYPHPPEHGAVLPETGPRWPLSRTDTGYVIEPRGSNATLHFAAAERVCHLVAVTDRNSNRIDFDRDAAGVLTAVRHSGGYHLDAVREGGQLTELRLRDADVAVVRYRHDIEGRLTEVVNSSGLAMRFDYDHANRITKWTDRNSQWYRYVYDADGRCVANEGSGGFLDGSFTYEDGVTRFTDALGHTTTYVFDDRRRVIARTDALGHMTTQEWDEHDRLLARTDALGHTTRFDYDADGNLVTTTRPDGTQALAEYDAHGRITTFVGPDGAVWRQEYDGRGNLAAETDPDGSVRRYGHDEHGHRVAVTDTLGHVRRIETNAAGLPVAVTDPTGATTTYTRDPFGRAVAVTDPLGRTTRFSWTVEGRMLSRTRPDGATERWRYDAEGNEVGYVDPMGRESRTRTTHFNLPVEEIRPDGSTFRYVYDRTLRLAAVVDAGGREWRYSYDAAGNVVREVDFNGRTLTYSYDATGGLVERVNGAGQAVAFTRDALGRIVERRSADDVTTLAYDPAGRLMRARNTDAELSYTRDALGRVLAETVNGRTVASTYDRLGRRTGRRTPTGAESRWDYDANSRPVNLTVGTRALSFGYDAAGQEVSRTFGDDLLLAQTWDANRRLIAQAMTGGAGQIVRRGYRYQPDDNLVEVDDLVTGGRRYQVDPLGRVTAVDARGWSERYTYDASGNVSSDGASYDGTLVRTARDAHFEYDRQGRVVLRRRKRLSRKPDLWRYQWNADDRLVAVTTPDGQRWTYQYDPLGRRIAKQRLAADSSVAERVDFTWDGSVLAEQTHTSGRTTSWEFDTASFRPLAQLERVRDGGQSWVDEQFYAIVTDLVGTPTELVDANGEVAWRQGMTLWGDVFAGPQRADTPLRFPGQYFDPETGLHYNYLRHYDPVAARYLSPDPLGLFGGPSPHAYVHNPTGWTDALGLTESSDIEMMDPNDINFSQRSVTENSYADVMGRGDWRWNESPVHVMEVDGQLVSYDNRRLDAAREAGVPVGVVRVDPNAPHPDSTTGKTWAEKFQERFRDPRNRGPNGEPVPNTGLPDRPQALPPGCGGGRRRRRR